jgi:ABC-type Fe3+/spermidine/putrescine transport system ATPase subunit
VLSLEDIRVVRGGRTILDRLDLSIPPGEIRLLIGTSGAGKTTLLRLVAGLDVPDSGSVRVDGRLASADGVLIVPHHRRGVAMAFQDGALWPHMSVEQHLTFGLRRKIVNREERMRHVGGLLQLFGLDSRRRERPSHLSGGERQRLGLARALSLEPRLLLLDEPLAHVDLQAQRELAQQLARWITERKMTALWVTHRPGEVTFVGGSISLLDNGRIARQLEPDEVASWLDGVGS